MELVEDHDAPEDYDDPDWDASMDIRNEQSPDRHVDQNNEFFSEEENKDERMYLIDILFII